MMSEVLNELLIEEASAYVLDEASPSIDLKQAARNAVVKRLEWLDGNFLAALNAYMSVPGVAANAELRALLGAIREEVLDLVSARMPPSVQVLSAALNFNSQAGRASVVSTALSGGAGALPFCDLDALGAAASQLVEDMEDQQVVADRVLLARLVLLREELRLKAEQHDAQQQFFTTNDANVGDASNGEEALGEGSERTPQAHGHHADVGTDKGPGGNRFFAFHRANLPARCAAFMKELLLVPERDRRLGLISKAFQEDWVSEAPPSQGREQPPQEATQAAATNKSKGLRSINVVHQDTRSESLDVVRPGRFFSTLLAMQAELEQRVVSSGLGSSDGGEGALSVLRQLEAIRLEALVALDRMQRQRPQGLRPSFDADDSTVSDYELDMHQ